MIMMNDRIILFVKFGEEKYIKRLLNGQMYFSNAARFRQTEQKLGLKGQGDAGEVELLEWIEIHSLGEYTKLHRFQIL